MDFSKANVVSEFMQYKNATFGIEFKVKLEIHNIANNWTPIKTDLIIENNIPKDDFTFVFMNDIVRDYLGNVQIDMNYLSNMKFDGKYLFFSTNSKKVRLS
ncbi:hypothetical protein [Treponema saccharophilum]|uniref:Uncharacterized protein n=1 Tax=Treponema saccharophilum DSM 2985 TaxID=907348 RepID=H7EJF0_9SPIR|nr:hypothetical protein [Treponema saccharophilum]EIC02311.1 hypothetical protein TresaDRAFT_1575 [Treponema saccharophilum DSM 2985]BDC97221.1 hypothetical protein TRSA_23200 [Treponema saccharophilum]